MVVSRRWPIVIIALLICVGNVVGQVPPKEITYGSTRQSTEWITIHGAQSPVDRGLEFQGKKIYLTLMFDVAAVDVKTKKTLWSDSAGAFWDKLGIVNLAKKGDADQWAVELSSTRQPEYRQRYDLDSGKKLDLIGAPGKPAGKMLAINKAWSGSEGKRTEKLYQLVASAQEWTLLREELFPKGYAMLPENKEVDFTKEVLLVCYAGKSTNWKGITVELAVEDPDRLLLRLHRQTYQTIGNAKEEHPYGLIVLPKLSGKEYVLEYNRQSLIGGPADWKEFMRLKVEK